MSEIQLRFLAVFLERGCGPDTVLILSGNEVFNPALLKKRGQNESKEPLVLTRTPLGPGLPCGPAEPCKKRKDSGEVDQLLRCGQAQWFHMVRETNTSDSEWPYKRNTASFTDRQLKEKTFFYIKLHFIFPHAHCWQCTWLKAHRQHTWKDIREPVSFIYGLLNSKCKVGKKSAQESRKKCALCNYHYHCCVFSRVLGRVMKNLRGLVEELEAYFCIFHCTCLPG